MSANPSEVFNGYAPGVHGRDTAAPSLSERRRRPRIRVHWPVLLFRNDAAQAVASTTLDLSSSGFFCLTATPFIPGEQLICALKVPFHDPKGKHLDRNLECMVRVVRVEARGEGGGFGVACRIEDYHIANLIARQWP
jgi:hypothetical protein